MSPDARSASPAVDKGGSANPFGNVFSQYAYYLDFLNIFLVVFLFFFFEVLFCVSWMCWEEFARSLAMQRLFLVSFVGFRVYSS